MQRMHYAPALDRSVLCRERWPGLMPRHVDVRNAGRGGVALPQHMSYGHMGADRS